MRRAAAMGLMILLQAVPSPAAQPEAEEELEVAIVLPTYGEALFGEVEVGADIYPSEAEISRVEFYLDGRLAGLVQSPPFEVLVDAGYENEEHHFQVVVYSASGAVATSGVTTPKIETDEEISVDLQQLYVTVERGGQRYLDLRQEDFAVFDNGVRQDLVTFERGDVPFTAVLLVDASTSMRGRRLKIALEGVEAFVGDMRELDEAKLILFSDRALHETPFTTFSSVVTVGLAGIRGGGGTALNDCLYLAMKRLEKREGRRVVVILSDGIDVESVLPMDRVRWAASQQQPVLYWIRLNERATADDEKADRWSTWRDPEEHGKELRQLRLAVEESGGRIQTIRRIEDVRSAFQWILEDLRNQYVLGYYPSESGKTLHKVHVRVRQDDLEVRSRGSYLEPSPWNGGR